ncbi:MAG: RAD55 family ATPase [Candidatus Heimdallarchaeota archaeon]
MSQNEITPARFGLPILDAALGGGVPRGSVILLEDEIGVNADLVALHFLTEGLRGGETGYVLSTEHPYKYYVDNLRTLGVNAEILIETERMVFIDAFTNPYGYSDIRSEFKNVVNNLTQPRAISESIRRALLHTQTQNIPCRGLIDSASAILLASENVRTALSFVQNRIASNKEDGTVTIMTLHRDIHSDHDLRALEHLVDGVISITLGDETYSTIKILKMRGSYTYSKKPMAMTVSAGQLSIMEMQ